MNEFRFGSIDSTLPTTKAHGVKVTANAWAKVGLPRNHVRNALAEGAVAERAGPLFAFFCACARVRLLGERDRAFHHRGANAHANAVEI